MIELTADQFIDLMFFVFKECVESMVEDEDEDRWRSMGGRHRSSLRGAARSPRRCVCVGPAASRVSASPRAVLAGTDYFIDTVRWPYGASYPPHERCHSVDASMS